MDRSALATSLGLLEVVLLVAACGGPSAESAIASVPTKAGTAGPSDAATTRADEPTQGATQIDCGDFHTCARMVDGRVRCWGRNTHGQLGDGTTVDRATAVSPDLRGAVEVAAGSTFSCARLVDGTVRCWGSGRLLGDGSEQKNAPPTAVPHLTDAQEIRAAGLVACTRHASGARCWGLAADRERRATRESVVSLGAPVELATASAHACARQRDGTVRCWGDFAWTVDAAKSFLAPDLASAQRLVTGDDFLCAIVKDGAVRCWGRNDDGQLGRAPDEDVHAAPVVIAGVTGAKSLAAGEGQACAVLGGGEVMCWGGNDEGELGLGTRTTSELPQRTLRDLAGVRDVCIGSSHACARTETGAVHCWGDNAMGQVGDGTHDRALTPKRVVGL